MKPCASDDDCGSFARAGLAAVMTHAAAAATAPTTQLLGNDYQSNGLLLFGSLFLVSHSDLTMREQRHALLI